MSKNEQANRQPNPHATGPRQYNDRRVYGGSTSGASWSEVNPDELLHFITKWCDAGNCAIFGKTSDGGALSITAIAGSDRYREWPKNGEEALAIFTALLADL